jgi:8-oxo-dGTP diphosphatase
MDIPLHYVVNFVILKEDKILLEYDSKIGWKLPGGHVEENEAPHEAVLREALEELNIKVDFLSRPLFHLSDDVHSLPVPFEAFIHKVDKDTKLESPHANMGLVYTVTTHDELTAIEGQEVKWFTQEEIERSEIHEAVKLICKQAYAINNHI